MKIYDPLQGFTHSVTTLSTHTNYSPFSTIDRATHIRLFCHQCIMPFPFLLFNLIPHLNPPTQIVLYSQPDHLIPFPSHLENLSPPPYSTLPSHYPHLAFTNRQQSHLTITPYPYSIHPPLQALVTFLHHKHHLRVLSRTQVHAQAHSNLGTNGTSHSFLLTGLPLSYPPGIPPPTPKSTPGIPSGHSPCTL